MNFLFYRFTSLFNHDADSMPRVWTGKEDIRAITKIARSSVRVISLENNRLKSIIQSIIN